MHKTVYLYSNFPNGGAYKKQIFRVGHIGAITIEDYDALFCAFDELKDSNFF